MNYLGHMPIKARLTPFDYLSPVSQRSCPYLRVHCEHADVALKARMKAFGLRWFADGKYFCIQVPREPEHQAFAVTAAWSQPTRRRQVGRGAFTCKFFSGKRMSASTFTQKLYWRKMGKCGNNTFCIAVREAGFMYREVMA